MDLGHWELSLPEAVHKGCILRNISHIDFMYPNVMWKQSEKTDLEPETAAE